MTPRNFKLEFKLFLIQLLQWSEMDTKSRRKGIIDSYAGMPILFSVMDQNIANNTDI